MQDCFRIAIYLLRKYIYAACYVLNTVYVVYKYELNSNYSFSRYENQDVEKVGNLFKIT